jgi:hypothetical protein
VISAKPTSGPASQICSQEPCAQPAELLLNTPSAPGVNLPPGVLRGS